MKKTLSLFTLCLFTLVFSIKAEEITVSHSTSGDMSSELTTALGTKNASTITKLIVDGDAYMTLADCHVIRDKFKSNTKGTFVLDVSGAKFEADSIPGVNDSDKGAFHAMLSLGEAVLPSNIRVVGYRAFRFCDNLKTINLNDGLKKIMDYSFSLNNGDRPFNIPNLPNSVEYIGAGAFENAKFLAMDALPSSLEGIIYATTFKATKVSCVEFPKGVSEMRGSTYTSSGAFNCIAASLATFTTITFHDGITSIGNNVFRNQTKITALTFTTATPPIASGDNPFPSVTAANVTVTVPEGAKSNYETHAAFAGMTVVEANPTSIEVHEGLDLNIYPNPTVDAFSVVGDMDIQNVKLYDLSGRLVANFLANNIYNVSDLIKGTYIIRINDQVTLKLIKK